MYINAVGKYIPSQRISNEYFLEVNGLSSDWIFQRTGIHTRSKVNEGEDGNTMGLAAVADLVKSTPYPIDQVDLIISAGYSPIDTVGTLAHQVQRAYSINNAIVFMVSSACSSFINAVEIVETYFTAGKASKALIICSEHNTLYSNEFDPQSGHLWGDAAVATLISKDSYYEHDPQVKGVFSKGLGHIGKGPNGVYLRPKSSGIVMPDGRDVFINATKYMIEALEQSTSAEGTTLSDLKYIVPHQANMRIVKNIAERLNMPLDRFPSNIEELGNTGSASAMLAAIQHWDLFKKGDLVGLTVFGGGYSTGALLLQF